VENRGFEALEAPPKRENHKYTRSPIYKQNKTYYQVRGAFDHRTCDRSHYHMRSMSVLCIRPQVRRSATCVRVLALRSIAHNCPRRKC
jgi:hypothetical protein